MHLRVRVYVLSFAGLRIDCPAAFASGLAVLNDPAKYTMLADAMMPVAEHFEYGELVQCAVESVDSGLPGLGGRSH
jgi:hypothetical protein